MKKSTPGCTHLEAGADRADSPIIPGITTGPKAHAALGVAAAPHDQQGKGPAILALITAQAVRFSPLGTSESEADACAPLLAVARRHLAALARELRRREQVA